MGDPNILKKSIMVKSTCAGMFEEFGVPHFTLSQNVNVLLPLMLLRSLKHLCNLIVIVYVNKENVVELVRFKTI